MPKAIGFIYSNDDSNQSMNRNVHSVDEIEEVVGMDFFYHLPDSIEGYVEEMKDLFVW
jgi:endonuclease G